MLQVHKGAGDDAGNTEEELDDADGFEEYTYGDAIVAESPTSSSRSFAQGFEKSASGLAQAATRESKAKDGAGAIALGSNGGRSSSNSRSAGDSTLAGQRRDALVQSAWMRRVAGRLWEIAQHEERSRRAWLPAFAVTLIVWVVYYLTAYPSLSGGDSGELIMTTCQLSMAHPPGYPTYTMVGWLFHQLFSFGNPARRINILTATFGSLAAGFIHLTVYHLSLINSHATAALAALGFAFSPTVWLYSVQGEVFAMNNFLCSLLAYLTLKFLQVQLIEQRVQDALINEAGLWLSPNPSNTQKPSVKSITPASWQRVLSVLMPTLWSNHTKRRVLLQNLEAVGLSGVSKGVTRSSAEESRTHTKHSSTSDEDNEEGVSDSDEEESVLAAEGRQFTLADRKASVRKVEFNPQLRSDSKPSEQASKHPAKPNAAKKATAKEQLAGNAHTHRQMLISKSDLTATTDVATQLASLTPYQRAMVVDVLRPHLETFNVGESANDEQRSHVTQVKASTVMSSWHVGIIGALVSGLCLTNQHTSVFYVFVTDLFILFHMGARGTLTHRRFWLLLLLVFIGMLPYAYLPLIAHTKPFDGWGDQRTLAGFLKHFLRKEYGTFQLAADGHIDPGMMSRLKTYAKVAMVETSYIILPLSGLGLIVAALARTRFLRVFSSWGSWVTTTTLRMQWTTISFFAWFLYMFVFHYLANLELTPLLLGVQARFWQQANLYIFMWGALGLECVVLAALETKPLETKRGSTPQPISKVAIQTPHEDLSTTINLPRSPRWTLAFVATLYLLCHVKLTLPRTDQSSTHMLTDIGLHTLNTFPSQAIVLLNGDLNNNMIKYHQTCENKRKDLRLISLQLMTWEWFVEMQGRHYPGVVFPGNYYHPRVPGCFSIKQFFDANYNNRPIFLCGSFKEGDPSYQGHYVALPYGQCQQILRVGEEPKGKKLTKFLRLSLLALPKLNTLGELDLEKYTDDTWEYAAYKDAISRAQYLASYVSFESNRNPSEPSLLKLAKSAVDYTNRPEFVRAAEAFGLRTPEELRSSGVIYGQYSRLLVQEAMGNTSDAMRAASNPDLLPKDVREKVAECESKMYYLWFLQNELTKQKQEQARRNHQPVPPDSDTKQMVMQRTNPYLGRSLLPEVLASINPYTGDILNPFQFPFEFTDRSY